ncbi:MAG TPA: hypothetical protein VN277_02225 [Acidiferrobacterales bacterium]|nr:hypothetical protein [Acidiferrobacterales bacterium]
MQNAAARRHCVASGQGHSAPLAYLERAQEAVAEARVEGHALTLVMNVVLVGVQVPLNPSVEATRNGMGRSTASGLSSVPWPMPLQAPHLEHWASVVARSRHVIAKRF